MSEDMENRIADLERKILGLRQIAQSQGLRITSYEERVDLQDKYVKTIQVDGTNAIAVEKWVNQMNIRLHEQDKKILAQENALNTFGLELQQVKQQYQVMRALTTGGGPTGGGPTGGGPTGGGPTGGGPTGGGPTGGGPTGGGPTA
jgi:hypothetical protein